MLEYRRLLPEIALMACAGALMGMSFLPDGIGWYCWFGLVPFLWAVGRARPLPAFLLGWVFGTAGYAAALHYFAGTISRFLMAPGPVAAALFLCVMAAHGLVMGLLAALLRLAGPRLEARLGGRRYTAHALLAVTGVVVLEGWYPNLIPWHYASSQHFHLPTIQILDVLGPAGLAWMIAAFNVSVWVLLDSARAKYRSGEGRVRWGFLAAMALVVVANDFYGQARIRAIDEEVARQRRAGRTLELALIQGAMPIRRKLRYERFWGNLEAQDRLTRHALRVAEVDLVVWPESTYGELIEYRRRGGIAADVMVRGRPFKERMREDMPFSAPVLFSAIGEVRPPPRGGRKPRHNIAVLAGKDHEFLGLVEKTHLIPFGEFMPLGRWLPLLYRFSPRTWRLSPAPEPRLLTAPNGVRLGVLICYEDFLTGFARRVAALGPQVLIHVSNDVWFGKGQALGQHLSFGALRAVETRRFLAKAVNTGITAVVDPAGRVVGRLPPGKSGFLIETLVPLDLRPPYVSVGRAPYYLAALLLAGLLAWSWGGPRHSRKRADA